MNLRVELFVLTVESEDHLRYVRREAPVEDGLDPDDVVWALLEPRHGIPGPAASVVHSTSWRWEEGSIVILTYVACARGLELPLEPVRHLAREAVTFCGAHPLRPRPERIREEDVLAHAIRHMGFLVHAPSSRSVADALSPEAREFFRAVGPGLAGRFPARG